MSYQSKNAFLISIPESGVDLIFSTDINESGYETSTIGSYSRKTLKNMELKYKLVPSKLILLVRITNLEQVFHPGKSFHYYGDGGDVWSRLTTISSTIDYRLLVRSKVSDNLDITTRSI